MVWGSPTGRCAGCASWRSGRRRRRLWPWALVLVACLGLFVLWGMNLNLMADITGYYNTEAAAFRLIDLIVCYAGMLAAVILAAAVAGVLRKIDC